MDVDEAQRHRVFFEVHQDLPREGPGNRACTIEALRWVRQALGSADPERVVDVGCGPGMQTLDLAAALPQARVVGIDLHEPFLGQLVSRADGAGLTHRISAVRADMNHLPLATGAADVVWCEGAAYLVGVGRALHDWQRLLRPGGVCAFTEAVWLRPHAPAPARELWEQYPAMMDVAGNRDLVRRSGYRLVADFVLPAEAWWEHYYTPMAQRLAVLDAHYGEDPVAAGALAQCRNEIDVYRQFSDWYGYAFFIAGKP